MNNASEPYTPEWYAEFYRLRFAAHIAKLTTKIKAAYNSGYIASHLYGGEIQSAIEETFTKLVDQAVRESTCSDIGSAARLCRLIDFLGDKLPPDWETQRFYRLIAEAVQE